MRWEKVKKTSKQGGAKDIGEPGKRWGHTCNSIRGGELLYVFGGYGKNNCQTNQVHVFDTARRTWSQAVIKGTPPSPRDSHSCTTVADNLFVFGGTDGLNPLKDLHILDTFSHIWITPSVRGEGPEAREGHSAALIGKELFIIGGCGKSTEASNEVYYNDVHILDTETFVWRRAQTYGTPPSPRDSHTCSSWKNNIVVIGGEDERGSYLSDVYLLDTVNLTWTVLETSCKLPPRAGHSTVAFGKNLFVFGGFTDDRNLYDDLHMLDVETGLWAKVTATGDEPSARFSVAGDSLDPEKGGVLVFIGGCNMHLEPLDDMLFLYTGLVTENRIIDRQYTQRVEKMSMKKQLRLKTQEQHYSSPVHVPNIGQSANSFYSINGQQSMSNPSVDGSQNSQGKRAFHAKVTDIVPGGFTIETMIDGMVLRGVVFSNKKGSDEADDEGPSRKRTPKAVSDVKLNDDENNKSNNDNPPDQSALDCGQTNGVHGEESIQHESQTDNVAASIIPDITPADATQLPEVPENLNPLDSDVVMHDAPNSSTVDGDENMTAMANDATISAPDQDGAEPTVNEYNLPANPFGADG